MDEIHESVYQIPLTVTYCSSTPNATNKPGEYPCDINSYKHTITYKGYKQQFNPDDPKLRCKKDTSCPVDDSPLIYAGLNLMSPSYSKGVTGDLFKYYLPKGTVYIDIVLYGPPTNGQAATIARIGSPPTGQFPTSFSQFANPSAYPTVFPAAQYPDVRAFWSGKNIKQLTENEWFAINEGGLIRNVAYNPPIDTKNPLQTGNWLYVRYKRYDASQIPIHTYAWGADKAAYKEWYTMMENTGSWMANGDPADTPLSVLSVIPDNREVAKEAGTTTFRRFDRWRRNHVLDGSGD